MFLQSLKLNNIRSYSEETITFPEGSTLLSGDIGTGKSTILLATEFALFGTSRPDLPAEALLKKGCTQGSVELTFQLNQDSITIKRSLKKEKAGIKQTAGYIKRNEIKKELMPVELKAEMIQLLGYPEEILSKNKNFIFRYTVYTPQEEMKLILQDNPEIRLDILRKVFNVDKYKNIRDNLHIHLKQSRLNIAQLKTKIEPLEQQQQQLQTIEKEQIDINQNLKQLQPKVEQLQNSLQQQQQQLQTIEKEQQELINNKQQLQNKETLLKEKTIQLKELETQQQQSQEEIKSLALPEGTTSEELNLKLQQNRDILTKRASYLERTNLLQQTIKEKQQKVELIKDLPDLKEKEQLIIQLSEELKSQDNFDDKRKQLNDLLEQTITIITRNQTIQAQSQQIFQKISSLDQCPTCQQTVSKEHKQSIQTQQEEEIKKAEEILLEANKKKSEILQQRDIIEVSLKEIAEKERQLNKNKLELERLKEKRIEEEQLKADLINYSKENNQLMEELSKIKVEELQLEIKKDEELLQQINKKIHHDEQIKKTLLETQIILEQTNSLQQEVSQIKEIIKDKKDLTEEIKTKKEEINNLTKEERELAVQQAQLKTQLQNKQQQITQLKEEINKLIEQKNQLIRQQEIYHWLQEYFLNLTYTIEKQIMINIHQLFNQFFQEWFSILIDDENISSKIDDAFSPIIEQNGYEISFQNLSGGEKTSAALAYRLALNRVINDVIHEIKTKDLLILDEPTDGFSSDQLDKVRDVLDRLKLKQMLIVSHESKIESFVENIIRVNKEGQVSKIEN